MLAKTPLFVTLSLIILYILYSQPFRLLTLWQSNKPRVKETTHKEVDSRYLIWSSKCKIPNLQPFNKDTSSYQIYQPYKSCSNLPLLSFVTVKNNQATLYINQTAILFYNATNVSCCYNYVSRDFQSDNPDNKIQTTSCVQFENSASLNNEFVVVKCNGSSSNKEIYRNVHAAIKITPNLKTKVKFSQNQAHLSVLSIGIDSVSRLHLARALPKTRNFLEKYQWIELRGYNKIGDNTFPNLMGILTGMHPSASQQRCQPKEPGALDKCQMLWYDFKNLGFVTAYAEDETKISTFNFNKKGFLNPPTDFYFRPYLMGAEKFLKATIVDDMTYCTGPESSGERVFNLIRAFASTFTEYLYFGFFWMNTFSHNKLSAVSRMDLKIEELLNDLRVRDSLKNTIVFFYSDHGVRFGSIRYTRSGWLEERLPFFFIYIPEWFKNTYSEQYKNLQMNSYKLTTPYDFYMTLQDILVMGTKNYTVKPSIGCPRCQSLFDNITIDRSCEDAGIVQHWCTCRGYRQYSKTHISVRLAIRYILLQIYKEIKSYGEEAVKCATYKFEEVISSSISENLHKNDTYLLVVFRTMPTSVFEATVSIKKNKKYIFELRGSVSRLNYYQSDSKCVTDPNLKKYCYCNR